MIKIINKQVCLNTIMEIKKIDGKNFSCNSYVIFDKKIAIIDPGFGIIDYGIDINNVDYVLLTHNHFDHSGNCYLFKNAKVLVTKEDLQGVLTGNNVYAEAFMNYFERAEAEILPKEVNLGEMKLKVIKTPGHTKGSCCFYDRKRKILFSGDTIFADGVGNTQLYSGNLKDMKKSIIKLSKVGFKILHPGHWESAGKESIVNAVKILKELK